jgi:hemerythrin-like domain-containing protein
MVYDDHTALFPRADKRLTDADQEELYRDSEQIEAREMGEGVHEQYHQCAHQLTEH